MDKIFNRPFWFFLYSFLIFNSNFAKSEFTSFVVDKIELKGLRKIEPEAVLDKISATPGKIITSEMVRADIEKLYRLKNFESIEVLRKSDGGKNILLFELQEKPIISKIIITGNDEEDEDDLKTQIKSKEYSIVDINTIQADVVAIQKYYEEKGFYLAKVSYEIKPRGKENVVVTYNIKEFDKVMVKRVTFLGNKDISDDELKTFMLTREETLLSGLSGTGNFKEFNFQADIERLSYYYKTKGYLQVNLGSPIVTVSEDKKWIFITIQVAEGPKFTVNDINFTGDLVYTDEEMREKLTLLSNDFYNEEKLRADIQMLTEMYQDKGYAFVNVLRTLDPVPGENKVNITYSFEKGKIAYFGNINIRGNTKTRDKVIRRELRVYEGMMFSGSKLRISKENVNRLGFFENNSVIFNTVTPKGKDNVLDLDISVKERQTGQISVGAGYSTATKAFFQASVKQNNFRGLGQDLSLNLNMSDVQQTYSVGFTEPYFNDTRWSLGGLVYKTRNTFISSFDFEKQGFDLRVGYPLVDYTRLYLTYSLEDAEISNVKNPTIDPDVENGIASGIEVSVVRDKRNNTFEPTKGYMATVGTEYVGLGFDQRWIKTELEGRYYYPVVGDLILRSRVRALQLFQTTDRKIPRTEKFAMGGARTLRGYNLEEIGPRKEVDVKNNDGKMVKQSFNMGGLYSLLGTLEFEHPLIQEAGLKWVVFYDIGNIYESYIGKDQDYDLKQDFGYGFRWFSPIGVLRFEFAHPINRGENTAPNQFYFDIGQLF